jgi:hypothetical protein
MSERVDVRHEVHMWFTCDGDPSLSSGDGLAVWITGSKDKDRPIVCFPGQSV